MRRPLLTVAVLASLALAAPAVAQDAEPEPPPRAPAGTDITEMLAIPGGVFTMGREGDTEMPPHRVKVDPFYLDRTEVTNSQYALFCEATDRKLPVFWGLEKFRCGPDFPDHPVVGVSQGAARAYAEWVGKRLPTEAEWEFAARGGLENLRYDLADTTSDAEANYKNSGPDGTTPVGSYRPNGYGLHDMIGNVREHTSDRWGAFTGDPEQVLDNPTGPETGSGGVVKGGGWYSGSSCAAVYVRNPLARNWGDFNVGFRCARGTDGE